MQPRPGRYVRITALVGAALVVVHALTWDMVRWRDGSFITDPTQLVTVGADKANLFRLSLVADALGSYLLTLPATIALWRRLRARAEWVDVAALGGVLYAGAGAVAAVALGASGAPLIREFAEMSSAESASVASSFGAAMNAAIATWQIVCVAAVGVWWLASGWLLRNEWRWFGRFSMAAGVGSIALGAAKALGAAIEPAAPSTIAFLPIAVWIGWLGWLLATREVSR